METENKKKSYPTYSKGIGVGIVFVLVGVLLLGINFGWIPYAYKSIVFSWPSILILIGVFHFSRRSSIVWGCIWIFTGLFFLLPRIIRTFPEAFPNIVAENFTAVYWPVLLIIAGVFIIVHKAWFAKKSYKAHWAYFVEGNNTKAYTGSKNFEKNSIFGSGEHIILDTEFNGGEANAIFGGITIDLRRTSLPPGETKLEINAVFGGVTLLIPGDWNVETRVDAIFGGFEDKRRLAETIDTTRKLVVVGSCVFGGGEISS